MDKVKKRKWAFVFLFSILFMFMASPSMEVKAAINSHYGNNTTGTSYSDPTKADDDAGIVGLLSLGILQIGNLIEGLVAWLVAILTGGNVEEASFPWADQIIFNAIPILDVNFINPAEHSLFDLGEGTTRIGNVIRNLYFTGISIAVGFLSLIVGIMAIRMAISTIASTKARYKESITQLLTTLVLIFGLHFLLSGMFYVNEKMVEIASQIVVNLVGQGNDGKTVSSLGNYFNKTARGEKMELFGLFELPAAAPIPTVLYLMFIYQSLIFLVAYFKRFFYVVILSIIGPFVVIYDFLQKAIS